MEDHRYTNTGNRGLMIAAAIKTLLDNREAWVRSQPGRKKGFDLDIAIIKNAGGQIFEMDMPYTSNECAKNYTAFKPTPEATEGNIVITNDTIAEVEIDENEIDFVTAIDEFDNA